MKNHPCCAARTSTTNTRRATGLAGAVLSGIPLLLMPKCPLCVAAYVTLLTGASVSTATAGQLRTGILVLCILLATGFIATCLPGTRARRRKTP